MYLSIVTWLLVWFRLVVVFIAVEGLIWFIGGLVALYYFSMCLLCILHFTKGLKNQEVPDLA